MRRCSAFLTTMSVLVSTIALCSVALAYTAKPIPAGTKPPFEKIRQQALEKFNQRVFVEAYRKVGIHDPKWDADAAKFLEGVVESASGPGKPQSPPDLIKAGKQLVDSGCKDPLVATCLGILMCRAGKYDAADPILETAAEAFEVDKAYPRYCAGLAPKYLLVCRKQTGDTNPGSCEKWVKLTAKWMAKSQVDGSFVPGEMRLRISCIEGADVFDGLQRAVCEAIRKEPGVDPYLAKVALGLNEIVAAWDSRGSDWGYMVSAQGWKGFGQHLGIARKALAEAWKLHPEYPQAPTLMITLAMAGEAGPGETPRLWFDRAVAAEWDHPGAYARLENALLPRWGGSVQQMYAFGAECARTKRFDSGVPENLVTQLKQIEVELGGNKEYWQTEKTTNLLNMVFDGYEQTGDDASRLRSKSERAAISWYAGREDEAKKLLKELGDKLDTTSFDAVTGVPYQVARISLENGMRMWEPVKWNANGHYYQICRPANRIKWDDAKSAAASMAYAGFQGHLATSTSKEEDWFISSIPHTAGYYWIGASRPRDKEDGWQWITGEPWSYTVFHQAAPPDGGKSSIGLVLWSASGSVAKNCNDFFWMPCDQERYPEGFIVEYE
jgi:hypothetical protein